MEDDEDVVEETTENVDEQATEELVEGEKVATESDGGEETKTEDEKLYSEEDIERLVNEKVNDLLPKKLARKEAKLIREFEKKHKPLEDVVKAGMNTEDIEEATSELKKYYEDNGVVIPKSNTNYSEREERLLAKAEADEIIESDDVESELDSLSNKQNLNTREKIVYEILTNHKQVKNELKELKKIGAEEILNDKDFLKFKNNFKSETPIKEIYDVYEKLTNKDPEPIGSMKSTGKNEEKEYITEEEYSKLSDKDFDNPKILERIRRSIEKRLIAP